MGRTGGGNKDHPGTLRQARPTRLIGKVHMSGMGRIEATSEEQQGGRVLWEGGQGNLAVTGAGSRPTLQLRGLRRLIHTQL